jgi:hypothetical protein
VSQRFVYPLRRGPTELRPIDLGDGCTVEIWRQTARIRHRGNTIILAADQIKKLCCEVHAEARPSTQEQG